MRNPSNTTKTKAKTAKNRSVELKVEAFKRGNSEGLGVGKVGPSIFNEILLFAARIISSFLLEPNYVFDTYY